MLKFDSSGYNGTLLTDIAQVKALAGELIEKNTSPVFQVIGDSTGNNIDEWVYLLAQKLAAAYPAHNVKYALYDQPNSRYAAWTDIQHVGEDRYFQIKSTDSGSPCFVPDADIVKSDPDGDIDIRIPLTQDDWQLPGNNYLFCKSGGAGHYCFLIRLISNKITLYWSVNGTDLVSADTAIDTTSWVDGSAHWIRITLDVDNGSGGFTVTGYTSDDGITWSGLTPVVGAGATSIYVDATANYYVGSTNSASGKQPGKYYEVQLKDGIDGIELFPQPLVNALRSPTDTTVTGSFGGTPTIFIFNASVSGSGMSDWNAEAYVNAAIPKTFGAYLFISLGHNDSYEWDAAYIAKWDAFMALINTRAISSNKLFVTQNPILLPAYRIKDRAMRRRVLMGWAQSKGMKVIDTYLDFIKDSRGVAALLNADGLHPVAAGQAVWADRVWNDLHLS